MMAVALAAWFTVRQHPHVLHDAHAPPPLTLFERASGGFDGWDV
ncbi:MAG: hypothetical protein ACKV22_34140 [Bryobacteraceae bacterium]